MRSKIACALSAVVLASCQGALPPPPLLLQDMQPIDGAITVGSATVRGALQTETKHIDFRQGRKQGSLVITSRTLLDASRTVDSLVMRAQVIAIEVELKNAHDLDASAMARRLRSTEGTVIELELDLDSDAANVHVTQNGAMITYGGEAGAKIAKLIKQNHLGGQTVMQGQEVMRFELSNVLPEFGSGTANASFAGRVIGRARHDNRQVIVVGVAGSFDVHGTPVHAAGTYLVDILTGISIRSEMTLSGMEVGNAEMNVSITQQVEL